LAATLLLLGAVTAGSAGIAAAKDLRYPESGPVAFLLHLPDIWTAKAGNSGSMLVIGPDGFAAISLTLMQENEVTLARRRTSWPIRCSSPPRLSRSTSTKKA
jgi:hypothetical protein